MASENPNDESYDTLGSQFCKMDISEDTAAQNTDTGANSSAAAYSNSYTQTADGTQGMHEGQEMSDVGQDTPSYGDRGTSDHAGIWGRNHPSSSWRDQFDETCSMQAGHTASASASASASAPQPDYMEQAEADSAAAGAANARGYQPSVTPYTHSPYNAARPGRSGVGKARSSGSRRRRTAALPLSEEEQRVLRQLFLQQHGEDNMD
ncbi:hypothetical protein IAT40_006524 [Kwoniella sp. CBS 6097]